MPDLDEHIKQLNSELETLKQNSDLQKIWDLENRVREVMQDASGSPQQEQVQDLLSAVISLRQQVTKLKDTSEKLKQVRTQIYAVSSSQALYDAISTLTKVLEGDPENTEASALVGELRARHPDFVENVRRILPETPPSRAVAELIDRMTDLYYQAKYIETVNLCNEILTLDSTNATAWDFLRRADENITRGYVPDTNLPHGAYEAYSRGISAKTEGLFEEARTLFHNALEIAQSRGFDWWKDPENQLRDIDSYLSEKKLVGDGDDLVLQGLWQQAITKYEYAWNLKHFPRTEKKHSLLIALFQIHQAREDGITLYEYLKSIHSYLAKTVKSLRQKLEDTALQDWSESKQLKDLLKWIQAEWHDVGGKLRQEGEMLLSQAENAMTIEQGIRRIDEALEQLETACTLLPKDLELEKLLRKVGTARSDMKDSQKSLEDAEQIMRQCQSLEVGVRSFNITDVLNKLENYAHLVGYKEYHDLLALAIRELLRCGDQALAQGNLEQAERHFREAENEHRVIFSVTQESITEETEEIQQRREIVESLKGRLHNQIKAKRAECSAAQQQYKGAIGLLEDLLTEDPLNKTNYELSIARYKKLDQLQSNEQDGKRYYRVQNWEKAVEFLKKALDLGSTDPEVEKFYEKANVQLEGWPKLRFNERVKLVAPILVFILSCVLTGFLIAANVLR